MIAAMISALWLGILTSISPCPLSTNIAAISYIGKKIDDRRHLLLSGLLYTLGRTLTYVVLGFIITASLLSMHGVSNFLQEYMHIALGPILVFVGMILLNLIDFSLGDGSYIQNLKDKVRHNGIGGAALLGGLFALSFCPVSAALFFGSLIPLSFENNSVIIIPGLYGIGTALPVIVFAFFISMGTSYVAKMYDKVKKVEKWAQRVTGVVFILIGIYFTLKYVFEII